ncbi:hypothetical protein GCM10009839_69060 [Catenulispora yoronensis]|uniref:Uncharacterized protein n=1 Tax=Catenulispora yoronensis TaxID=450799 RepID=A0ABN2V685_9ACTN
MVQPGQQPRLDHEPPGQVGTGGGVGVEAEHLQCHRPPQPLVDRPVDRCPPNADTPWPTNSGTRKLYDARTVGR